MGLSSHPLVCVRTRTLSTLSAFVPAPRETPGMDERRDNKKAPGENRAVLFAVSPPIVLIFLPVLAHCTLHIKPQGFRHTWKSLLFARQARQFDRERKRENEIFHLQFTSHGCDGQSWAGLKPRASYNLPYGRDPTIWVFLHCFSGH